MVKQSSRNYLLDLIRLLAACSVVFIHVRFPSRQGIAISCLARISVPFFFAVAGYFIFRIPIAKIANRIRHSLKILIWSNLLHLLVCTFYSYELFEQTSLDFIFSTLTLNKIVRWFLLGIHPFSETLWFLSAHLFCYLVLYLYVSFYGKKQPDYTNLYIVSAFLLVLYFLMSTFLPMVGITINYKMYYNGLFFGLPLFSVGVFIREYQEDIITNFHLSPKKEFMLILAGMMLSLLQCFGCFETAFSVGLLLELFALLLFANHFSLTISLPSKAAIPLFRMVSSAPLFIYVIHIPIISLFDVYSARFPFLSTIRANNYAYPLSILALSVGVSFLCCCIKVLLDAHIKSRYHALT